jgi:hypothetical protein
MKTAKLAWVFLLLASASLASATTYMAISDADLADQARVVARVKVIGVGPGPASRQPATGYLVQVEKVSKGYVPGSTLDVRVPGGVRADGLGLKLWGAPEFQLGETALLFLEPAADGSFHILHLMLGAFHARSVGGGLFAVQDLSGAQRLRRTEGPEPDDQAGVRNLAGFETWIADRALGVRRAADYWRERPAGFAEANEKYVQAKGPDGNPIRWFVFDDGGSVAWKLDSAGQPGIDPAQTPALLQAAIQAWNADSTSSIQYTYAGLSAPRSGSGLHGTDGVNDVLFNDPGNDVPGTFDCRAGGILALSGPYYYSDTTRSYRGTAYHETVEADVVFQDGTQCFFQNNPTALAEVMTHELGHTLGLAHSADSQALMWAYVHNDGRGARLSDDDRMAVSTAYGDGSFQPPPPPPPPAAPLKLAAAVSRAGVNLAWSNVPAGTAEIRIESQKTKTSFVTMAMVAGGTTAEALSGLAANRTYNLRIEALGSDGSVLGTSNVIRFRTLGR